LGNAVKFTTDGGIMLRIQGERRDDVTLELIFEIEDTGVGVAEAEITQMFQYFEQTHSGKNLRGGTGLGLAISQEYAHLMGGEISVLSAIGQGSIFRYWVPVELVDHQILVENSEKRRVIGLQPNQTPVKILLVDDDDENRLWMKDLLLMVGFQVQEASSGPEALEHWDDWRPALVFMDIRMTGMNGFETTRLIRERDKAGDTVIIALTATVLEENRQAIFEAGVVDLLSKPVDEALLFEKIEQHVKVAFLYDEELNIAHSTGVMTTLESPAPELLMRLPTPLRAGILEAVSKGDWARLDEYLKEVVSHNHEVAAYLRSLADQYDGDAILKLFSGDKL